MKLDMRFDAAGNPEDYDVDERKALLEAIARAVGFSSAPAGSTITIAAASVSITASFPVIDVADADAHIATASAYSTPNAFSAAINGQLAAAGATVSIDGTGGSSFAATSTATSIASPLRASSGGGLDSAIIIGAAVGGVVLALVAGCWCAKSKGLSKPAAKLLGREDLAATNRKEVDSSAMRKNKRPALPTPSALPKPSLGGAAV